jgi:hypothetical protein
VTRARLAGCGYGYVGFALVAFVIGTGHPDAQAAFYTAAVFAFLWFLASLRARLDRYDPEGFYSSTVMTGGAAFVALQAITVYSGSPRLAAPTAACAATIIIGSSLAALRARKVKKWFGYAGLVGGAGELAVGLLEGAWHWTIVGTDTFASGLGFMIWVCATATYLLKR